MRDIMFSHAVPTAYLEIFDPYSSCYLILAHCAKEDKKYAEFFRNSEKFKILDNGAYELGRSIDMKDLIMLYSYVDADYVVCPDVFLNKDETLDQTFRFLDMISKLDYPPHVMGVPQGQTIDEYLECAEKLAETKMIDFIGVSFLVTTKCFAEQLGVLRERVECVRPYVVKLLEEISDWEIHLLGIGNPIELILYRDDPRVISCDSSAAYSLAKQGLEVTPLGCRRDRYGKINVNDQSLDAEKIALVQRNMLQINEFCKRRAE